MKQLLQSAADRATVVAEVPAPGLLPGTVLVRNGASLISIGTERMAVDFSRKSLLEKARARPDLVQKVVQKALVDGVLTAIDTARARLDQPLVLGYSCAGTVIAVGGGVSGLSVGDRVACAGAGHASHAEIVRVPKNLVAVVPEGVALEHSAFATVASVGLHGLRLAEVTLGESVAVIGLGLIGLLTVQMARAAGCHVVGIDVNPSRASLGLELGAELAVSPEEAQEAALELTAGRGMDVVLITAATPSDGPVELAGALCRDRGRVVVVGAVGMNLPRPPFYDKELSFRVSRSYGPGRYDSTYEEGGVDYPLGFVRWTEQRNLQAFLDLVASGKVQVGPLLTHSFPIGEGAQAYDLIVNQREAPLGIVLTYPERESDAAVSSNGNAAARATLAPAAANHRRVDMLQRPPITSSSEIGVGLLGAGSFLTGMLLPAMRAAGGLRFAGVCTTSGPSSHHVAKKFGFRYATTDESEVLADPATELVVIGTPHHLHARQIVAALEAGKHVFCEKPPALTEAELAEVVRAARAAPHLLLAVGYNRRFAPLSARLREHIARGGGSPMPALASYRVNAGAIPLDHWIQDPGIGGGRVLGEVCHFVDFLSFLTGALPIEVHAAGLPDHGRWREDNLVLTLRFDDGSVGTVAYAACGDRGMGKERVEVFAGGRSAVLDDFRRLDLHQGGTRRTARTRLRQDKGHRGEWQALVRALGQGGPAPIPLEGLVATSLATFAALASLRSGRPVPVEARRFLAAARGEGIVGGTG